MTTVVLIVHLLVALMLVGVVLIQRSEGGALGIGGGAGMMTGRGAGNILTKATAVLAALFFATSILLAILGGAYRKPASILDSQPATQQQPLSGVPQGPSVPLSK